MDGSDAFVPGFSIWIAFVLLVASVFAFVYYIDHMAHAIRAGTVIESIARETRDAVDRLFPEPVGREPERPLADPTDVLGDPVRVAQAGRPGVLVAVDESALLELASFGDRRAELVHRVGEFVPEGAPLFRLWGDWDTEAVGGLHDAVELGEERTLQQDAAFGFRQLVDVATRALSPGTNDPTTAVQAIDRLHDLLRRLAGRGWPSDVRLGDDGVARLILHRPEWHDYVRLAIDEVRLAGGNQIQVVRRLREVLLDLQTVAPADRQPILRQELQHLEATAVRPDGVRR